jgi:hypothetical protein
MRCEREIVEENFGEKKKKEKTGERNNEKN